MVLRLRGVPIRGPDEFAYWNIVFVIVLLTGPLTWVMNVVWLLPAAAVIIGQYRRIGNAAQAAGLAVCGLGLLWAGLPDTGAFQMLLPGTLRLGQWKLLQDPWKYPAAELAVFAGLLLLVLAAPRRPAEAAEAVAAPGA